MSGENEAVPGALTRAAAPRRLMSSGLMFGLLLAALMAILPAVVADRFLLSVGTNVLITAIAAVSLHLVVRTGHVSLGHASFMGVGAYTATLLVMKLQLPFAMAVVASFLAPALLGLLIGPLVLRLTGKYFVLVTFLLAEIVRMTLADWTSLTGGANGIFGIPAPSPFFAGPVAFYYLVLGFAVVIVGGAARLLSSDIGRAMDAVRESERLAQCSGMPVLRIKVGVFVLACGLVGIAGALQASFVHYIDPDSFGITQSLNLLVINVIGGMNSLIGALMGTVFLVVLPELLRSYVELQRVIFGVILIVVMGALPGGLAELGARLGLRRRLVARR